MPTILLTNDDGPPSAKSSPYIYRFSQVLRDLGWEVKVVVPSSQKSWIGKAFHITETTQGRYYYPRDPDGLGETSDVSRPLKEGETAEWILLDGTPATCANVGLHNIFPGQIDLLISGPNLGRNTSTAFSLSSGTIGAALSASLSGFRSIALSYGNVVHPTPPAYFEPAHALASSVIQHISRNWGVDKGGLRSCEVDFYNINVPLVDGLLDGEGGLPVYDTFLWRNNYGRLFKNTKSPTTTTTDDDDTVPVRTTSPAGPDSFSPDDADAAGGGVERANGGNLLAFKFAPDMRELINPVPGTIPVGSDGWAMYKGYVSVTPLRAAFAEPVGLCAEGDLEGRVWKMKL